MGVGLTRSSDVTVKVAIDLVPSTHAQGRNGVCIHRLLRGSFVDVVGYLFRRGQAQVRERELLYQSRASAEGTLPLLLEKRLSQEAHPVLLRVWTDRRRRELRRRL